MKRILFLGDSLTAGYGLANVSLDSLPALLQQKINQENLPFNITNAGISGDTTAGGLQRIDLLLHQPVDVFVLELGANDILRGIAPKTSQKNLQGIVDKVRAKYPQAKLLLLGMELPAWIPGLVVAEFRAIFKEVANRNGMTFVPFFLDGVAGVKHLNLQDGIHPTAAGYKVIAERIWPALKELLED
jgi:acyl-CoA thioesterase-1